MVPPPSATRLLARRIPRDVAGIVRHARVERVQQSHEIHLPLDALERRGEEGDRVDCVLDEERDGEEGGGELGLEDEPDRAGCALV